jgi:hypothetical protein
MLASVVVFDGSYPFPGPWTLLPTVGTVLILVFTGRNDRIGRLLAWRPLVAVGLLSYSAYLWHQPVLAFLRVYAFREPGWPEITGAILLTFALSAFSWRFVEQPFRSASRTSTAQLIGACGAVSLLLLGAGYAMHASDGFPQRLGTVENASAGDIHIAYNEGAFAYETAAFEQPERLNVLILGNSFARDFLNMTVETLPMGRVEIVYRTEDGCLDSLSPTVRDLYEAADAIVFASGWPLSSCFEEDIPKATDQKTAIFYVGNKDFGYNLNWLMRLAPEDRGNQRNEVPDDLLAYDREAAERLPADHYISLLGPIVQDGRIPITDAEGRILTPDRQHLTRFGAIYVGARVLPGTAYARLFE